MYIGQKIKKDKVIGEIRYRYRSSRREGQGQNRGKLGQTEQEPRSCKKNGRSETVGGKGDGRSETGYGCTGKTKSQKQWPIYTRETGSQKQQGTRLYRRASRSEIRAARSYRRDGK
jgi:hypothetical protein